MVVVVSLRKFDIRECEDSTLSRELLLSLPKAPKRPKPTFAIAIPVSAAGDIAVAGSGIIPSCREVF